MPFDSMASDFDAQGEKRATELLEGRPIVVLSTQSHPHESIDLRSAQHEYLGVYLAAHCHLLVAIWDGTSPSLAGGTAQIVDFHLTGNTVFDEHASLRSPIDYTEDQSDLVFHIVCSRASSAARSDAAGRHGGEPATRRRRPRRNCLPDMPRFSRVKPSLPMR